MNSWNLEHFKCSISPLWSTSTYLPTCTPLVWQAAIQVHTTPTYTCNKVISILGRTRKLQEDRYLKIYQYSHKLWEEGSNKYWESDRGRKRENERGREREIESEKERGRERER